MRKSFSIRRATFAAPLFIGLALVTSSCTAPDAAPPSDTQVSAKAVETESNAPVAEASEIEQKAPTAEKGWESEFTEQEILYINKMIAAIPEYEIASKREMVQTAEVLCEALDSGKITKEDGRRMGGTSSVPGAGTKTFDIGVEVFCPEYGPASD